MPTNYRVDFDYKNERTHINFDVIQEVKLNEGDLIHVAQNEISRNGYSLNECSNISVPKRIRKWWFF